MAAAAIVPALIAAGGKIGSSLIKKKQADGGGGGGSQAPQPAVAQASSAKITQPPVPAASLAEDKTQNMERMKKIYGYPR